MLIYRKSIYTHIIYVCGDTLKDIMDSYNRSLKPTCEDTSALDVGIDMVFNDNAQITTPDNTFLLHFQIGSIAVPADGNGGVDGALHD